MSEQPVVTDAQVIDEEAELLAGSPEDQQIGQVPAPPTPEALAAMQTAALIDLAQAVKGIVSQQQATRQVPYHEIKPVTPFNPEGKRDRKKLKYTFLQHGKLVTPINLREEEIELINQLKPGRYWNRKIEVQISRDGTTLNLTWTNAKIEQRMEFNAAFPDLLAVLRHCIKERAEKEAKRKAGHVEEMEVL